VQPQQDDIKVKLSLQAVTLTDIRAAAVKSAITTILAPQRTALTSRKGSRDAAVTTATSTSSGASSSSAVVLPLLSVDYTGGSGGGSVEVIVRNFVCSLMPDPIKQSLQLANEVQAAALRMLGVGANAATTGTTGTVSRGRQQQGDRAGGKKVSLSPPRGRMASRSQAQAQLLTQQQRQQQQQQQKDFALAVHGTCLHCMLCTSQYGALLRPILLPVHSARSSCSCT
jgi:hypothetical protein